MRNWSGHVEFVATSVESPESVPALQSLVADSPRIRALGTGHSFNDLADTPGVHVRVDALPPTIDIDTDRQVARVPAGMRYGDLARALDAQGWAVHNLASLGHISVAGTVATGTHGSGDRNPTLSAQVRGLELVTATGDLVTRTAEGDPSTFAGTVVSLGALGVVTHLHLQVEPAFAVRQDVVDDVSHHALLADFEATFADAYSVSFFTTWAPALAGQVWRKSRVDAATAARVPALLDGHPADGKRHPLPGHDPVHCTEQGGVPGPWHERLPHFRLDFTPSSGDELQTEYLVPRASAVGLLRDLETMAARIHPLLQVSEIRTMCADELWLSGAYGRDTVGIHFTWQRRPEVLGLLAELDAVFADSGGRPHWGKLYDVPAPALVARYPRFEEFTALVDTFDPRGKFRNRTLEDLLGTA